MAKYSAAFALFALLFPAGLAAQDSSIIDSLQGGTPVETPPAKAAPAASEGGAPAKAGAGAKAAPAAAAGAGAAAADFDEDDFDEAEFEKNYTGPNIGVVYDERSKSGYFVIDTDDEYKEYHYLEQIRYDDLLFVLTDTLSRLTKDGFRWSSQPALEVFTEKLPESEVAFIYEINKKEKTLNARVQFPDFKISITAVRERDSVHRYDASSGRDMFQLINTFAYRINEVESVLGMDNIEYTMRYFRKDEPEAEPEKPR